VLDQELNGLPETYRPAILLCHLEGKTIKEAAQRLGWPQGTLAGRLARGRKLLAKRLASRGLVLSGGSLAAVVSQNVAAASVPTALMGSTVKAATMIAVGQATVAGVVPAKVAALTEGVMKAMLVTKLKTVTAALLVVASVGIGAGLLSHSTTVAARTADEHLPKAAEEQWADQRSPRVTRDDRTTELQTGSLIFGLDIHSDAGLTGSVVVNERNSNTGVGSHSNAAPTRLFLVPFVDGGTVGSPPVPAEIKAVAPKSDVPKTDLDRLQGVWSVVSIERGGKPCELDKAVFMVDGKRACCQTSDSEIQGGLYLEPTSKPKAYDLAMSTRTIEGIYSLEGDTLRLCYDMATEPKRPGGFVTERGSQHVLVVLKRTHGREVFPFRLPDGTRAFPTIIERAKTPPPPPRLITPQPEAKKLNAYSADERPVRVGRIFVVGNTMTEASAILKKIPLSPGEVLDYQALRTAEKNLAAFNPKITVIEGVGTGEFKDIQVTVQEK
jgi:uncharacterized protein (TIGR03067 family)